MNLCELIPQLKVKDPMFCLMCTVYILVKCTQIQCKSTIILDNAMQHSKIITWNKTTKLQLITVNFDLLYCAVYTDFIPSKLLNIYEQKLLLA